MAEGVRTRLQSGALPYRLTAEGGAEVLLITTGKSKRWSIPKGRAEPHLTLAANAAKEAFEEAGIRGEISPAAMGMFRSIKRARAGHVVIEVWVYLLRVTEQVDNYPEKGRRRLAWVSCAEAAQLLNEPLLRDLCTQIS
jgi:8-oxo-dGTP pyrophosphatase MutT (NUDIX family)